MDAAAELARNLVSKHQIQPKFVEMSRLTRGGTAEPVSRDQIFRHERGQGKIHFPCSADHEQDWQPYPVDRYSCYMCYHTLDHPSERELVADKRTMSQFVFLSRRFPYHCTTLCCTIVLLAQQVEAQLTLIRTNRAGSTAVLFFVY